MRHARTRPLLGAFALVAALAVTVAATPATAADEPVLPAFEALGLPVPGDPVDSLTNNTVIEEQLFGPHPEEWGGAYVDGDALVVKTVTRDVPAATAALAAIGVTQGVRVVPTTVSIRDLDELTATIVSDPSLAGAFEVGPEYSGSRVVVGLSPTSPVSTRDLVVNRAAVLSGAQAQVRARLRGSSIGIVRPSTGSSAASGAEGEAAPEPAPTTVEPIPVVVYGVTQPEPTSRYIDTSPYYGGNAIGVGTGSTFLGGCSSAFAWYPSTGTGAYMVSASHCYRLPNGTNYGSVFRFVKGKAIKIGSFVWSSGDKKGTLSGRHGDAALYRLDGSGNTAGRVFVGKYDSDQSVRVTGRVTMPANWRGSSLRTSAGGGPLGGHGDGEINPTWVEKTNMTITYKNGQRYTGLTSVGDRDECTGKGDSGGAVYQTSSGNARAVGIISGGTESSWGPINCYTYYTPIASVAKDWGGTLKTS